MALRFVCVGFFKSWPGGQLYKEISGVTCWPQTLVQNQRVWLQKKHRFTPRKRILRASTGSPSFHQNRYYFTAPPESVSAHAIQGAVKSQRTTLVHLFYSVSCREGFSTPTLGLHISYTTAPASRRLGSGFATCTPESYGAESEAAGEKNGRLGPYNPTEGPGPQESIELEVSNSAGHFRRQTLQEVYRILDLYHAAKGAVD